MKKELLDHQPIPRYATMASVVSHQPVIGNEYEITLTAPEIAAAAQPGQFIELLYDDNYSPLIRRPFSIYRVDREEGRFHILYQARGSFTSGLARKQEADEISVIGPLGNPFHWERTNSFKHILIAGGIGAPPIYFLAEELCRQRIEGVKQDELIVLNGARTRDLLVATTEFSKLDISLHLLTDDGSHGRQGVVTDLLKELAAEPTSLPVQIYACGPAPMLKAVGSIALRLNLPCQISAETSMPCGIGYCMGCAIKTLDPDSPGGSRYALACQEGPVFEAASLYSPG